MDKREPWKDIDPGMIEWDRKRREKQEEDRWPAQIPLHDYIDDRPIYRAPAEELEV